VENGGMDELHNELHRHDALLLRVESPWEVNGVNPDMAVKRVETGSEMGTRAYRCHVRNAAKNEPLPTMRRIGGCNVLSSNLRQTHAFCKAIFSFAPPFKLPRSRLSRQPPREDA